MIRKFSFLRLLLIVCFFITASFTRAAVEPMNVLFIGNSYTHYNNMPGIFQDIAVSKGVKINVEMSAKSNHTCKMHCERLELFEKIRSKKWDYVVIQGFSRELAHDPEYLDTSFVPFFNRIADSVYRNNSCTNILLYMTWGYKTGIVDKPELDTYQKMSDRIAQGYQYISDVYSVPIVPVGQVWETVKENHPEINLYQDDNQHPSLSGSYLIACTFYSAIFKANPEEGFIPPNVAPKSAAVIQSSAYNFVNLNVLRYKLRQNTLEVKYERTESGSFIANCKAFYPNASTVKWDFGDNNLSTKPEISHQYSNEGTYTVSLTVNDTCGDRVIYRKVYFKNPKKPKKNKPSKPITTVDTGKKI